MKSKFVGKRITGMLGILPENEYYFDDEVDNYSFPVKQTLRLKKIMGFNKHRISKEDSTASKFCMYGLKYMFEKQYIKREEIGAIVVVTLSPDYFVPQISNIIHGEFDLPEDVICMDVAQGCCGFLLGLMQSFLLLDHLENKKVLLFNCDVLSHKVSKQDRNDFPLVGDATSITVVENDCDAENTFYIMKNDGAKRNSLIIPAGGFACPADENTKVMEKMPDGNIRCKEQMHMDGASVFNFVQLKVPPLIDEILAFSDCEKSSIDYYLFHQPNRFMLQKLAEATNIPEEKLFMNVVENYGNPSGVSIPINIIHNLQEKMIVSKQKCCLSAFGSGLSWGAMVMELGEMDFCEMITSDL